MNVGPFPSYSAAEDALMIELYSQMPLAAIAARLGRSVHSVRIHSQLLIRRGQLDRRQRFYGRRWTAEEEQELRGRWPHQHRSEVAKAMGRSESSVQTRAAALHLGRGGPCYTATAVARLFGVDQHTVVYWISHGWLGATRTAIKSGFGCKWHVSYGDLERFITESPYHFDYRWMQEGTWWRRLAERETNAQQWLTARQAARRLGTHVGTIHRHLLKGWLPGKKTTGPSCQGDWRIKAVDLAQFRPRRPLGGHGGRGRPGMRRKRAAA